MERTPTPHEPLIERPELQSALACRTRIEHIVGTLVLEHHGWTETSHPPAFTSHGVEVDATTGSLSDKNGEAIASMMEFNQKARSWSSNKYTARIESTDKEGNHRIGPVLEFSYSAGEPLVNRYGTTLQILSEKPSQFLTIDWSGEGRFTKYGTLSDEEATHILTGFGFFQELESSKPIGN